MPIQAARALTNALKQRIRQARAGEKDPKLTILAHDRTGLPYQDVTQVLLRPEHGIYMLSEPMRKKFRQAVCQQVIERTDLKQRDLTKAGSGLGMQILQESEKHVIESQEFMEAVRKSFETAARKAKGKRQVNHAYKFEHGHHIIHFYNGEALPGTEATSKQKPEAKARELVRR